MGVQFRKIPFFAKVVEKISPYTFITKNSLHYMESINYQHMRNHIDNPLKLDNNPDHYTSTYARASLPMPYLDTPTGSKVPLWRLHPHRMFEMAENIGDCRVVFEAIIREVFRNGTEVVPKFKYRCPRCYKDYTDKPAKEYIPMNDAIAKSMAANGGPPQPPGDKNGDKNGQSNPFKDRSSTPKSEKQDMKKAPDNNEKDVDKPEKDPKKPESDPLKGQDESGDIDDTGEGGNPFEGETGDMEDEDITFECQECGLVEKESKFIKPDPEQRKILKKLCEEPLNNNNQYIIDLGKQFERDLNTVDSAYVLLLREYKIRSGEGVIDPDTGATGVVDNPEDAPIEEIVRVHPVQITMMANDEGKLGVTSANQAVWICPRYDHRDKILALPVCDRCGTRAFTAIAETNAVPFGLPVAEPKRRYYAKHELIWQAGKFHPDLLYGNSPLNAIWKKIMSLYHQDEYLWKYFDKERPPKSILAIGSRNFETVEAFFERQRQGARVDPYMPRPILLNTENVGAAMEYIDLTPNFRELELTELRTELRKIIASMFGIQPIYYGEQSKSGLGNDSLEVTLTNRTIKTYQMNLNNKLFYMIGKAFGVTDWIIKLVDSEDIDKLRDEQIKGQKIDNATKMYGMGFDVATDGEGEFMYSQFPNPERQSMMMGGGAQQNVSEGNMDKQKKAPPKNNMKTDFGQQPMTQRAENVPGKGKSFGKALTTSGPILQRYDATYLGTLAYMTRFGLRSGKTEEKIAGEVAETFGISLEQAREDVSLFANLMWLEIGAPEKLPRPDIKPIGPPVQKSGATSMDLGMNYMEQLGNIVKWGVQDRHTINAIIKDVVKRLNVTEAQAARDVQNLLLTAVDQT